MSILKFPADWYIPEAPDGLYYEFHRIDDDANDGQPLKFVAQVERKIHSGNSKVYRATLTSGDSESSPLDVVCKLVYGNRAIRRLQNEADYYCHELKEIQGKFVPRFRGLYEGETDEGRTVCLVVDYCGTPLYQELCTLKTMKKHAVIKAIVAVHMHGIRHCDFQESNIVVNDNGQPFIIDFDHAIRHKCELGVRIVFNTKEPLQQDMNCDELYWACKFGRVWTPRWVQYFSSNIPIEWTETFELLLSKAPPGADPKTAYDEAVLTFERLWEWEDEMKRYEERD